MSTLLYNAFLSLGEALLLRMLLKHPSAKTALGVLAGSGVAALLLALLLGENLFGITRLLSYGIFLHGFLLLAAIGALLRKRGWIASLLCAILALLLAAVAVDAFLVEPGWLEVSQVRVRSRKLKRPLRIAFLADFQTDHIRDYERGVIARVLERRPDLILLAGDHLQERGPRLPELREEFRELLRDLRGAPRFGIYAVRGNIDPPDWVRIFDGLSITAIETTRSIDFPEFRLTGLSMDDSFDATLTVAPSERFQIVLGHSPDFALGNVQADLLLAGHTHGGQVRLPGIGPLMTLSRVPRSWAAGVTALDGNRTLVVSRGIGMERGAAPRLRFFCRPELVLIDVLP
jgi:predicted MPP superfamily phosphohydrolase